MVALLSVNKVLPSILVTGNQSPCCLKLPFYFVKKEKRQYVGNMGYTLHVRDEWFDGSISWRTEPPVQLLYLYLFVIVTGATTNLRVAERVVWVGAVCRCTVAHVELMGSDVWRVGGSTYHCHQIWCTCLQTWWGYFNTKHLGFFLRFYSGRGTIRLLGNISCGSVKFGLLSTSTKKTGMRIMVRWHCPTLRPIPIQIPIN